MADAETLSLAFMRAHPAEAARVLEAVDPADSAALLARVPARVAAPVLAAMLPSAAARSVAALEDEPALALLSDLGTQPVVAVLRHLAEPRRARLIEGLPTAAVLASKLLIGYMEDSVGAWTDPDVIALPGTTRAAEALERVRHVGIAQQNVFVTGENGRLEGWLSLSALLRALPGASLVSVMTRPAAVLPAQTPLSGALAHPGWEQLSAMPVIESGERLVGLLTRDALARALRRTARPSQAAPADTLAGMLARGYWDALSGGAEAMATLLPHVRPIAARAHEH